MAKKRLVLIDMRDSPLRDLKLPKAAIFDLDGRLLTQWILDLAAHAIGRVIEDENDVIWRIRQRVYFCVPIVFRCLEQFPTLDESK
jgi:hypothetical protein